jgi:biotin carboxyl carrier protein
MVIKSNMVAIVNMIPFEVGTEVNAKDTVIMLECMKIMFDITAPVKGRIKRVLVKPGDVVEEGQPLLEIE